MWLITYEFGGRVLTATVFARSAQAARDRLELQHPGISIQGVSPLPRQRGSKHR